MHEINVLFCNSHPAEFEDSLNFVIQRTFLKDQNGDGKLSFKEYVSGDGE